MSIKASPSRIPQPPPQKAKVTTIARRTLRIGERLVLTLADGSTAVGLVRYASAHRTKPGSYAGIDLLPGAPLAAAAVSSRRYLGEHSPIKTPIKPATATTPTTTTTTSAIQGTSSSSSSSAQVCTIPISSQAAALPSVSDKPTLVSKARSSDDGKSATTNNNNVKHNFKNASTAWSPSIASPTGVESTTRPSSEPADLLPSRHRAPVAAATAAARTPASSPSTSDDSTSLLQGTRAERAVMAMPSPALSRIAHHAEAHNAVVLSHRSAVTPKQLAVQISKNKAMPALVQATPSPSVSIVKEPLRSDGCPGKLLLTPSTRSPSPQQRLSFSDVGPDIGEAKLLGSCSPSLPMNGTACTPGLRIHPAAGFRNGGISTAEPDPSWRDMPHAGTRPLTIKTNSTRTTDSTSLKRIHTESVSSSSLLKSSPASLPHHAERAMTATDPSVSHSITGGIIKGSYPYGNSSPPPAQTQASPMAHPGQADRSSVLPNEYRPGHSCVAARLELDNLSVVAEKGAKAEHMISHSTVDRRTVVSLPAPTARQELVKMPPDVKRLQVSGAHALLGTVASKHAYFRPRARPPFDKVQPMLLLLSRRGLFLYVSPSVERVLDHRDDDLILRSASSSFPTSQPVLGNFVLKTTPGNNYQDEAMLMQSAASPMAPSSSVRPLSGLPVVGLLEDPTELVSTSAARILPSPAPTVPLAQDFQDAPQLPKRFQVDSAGIDFLLDRCSSSSTSLQASRQSADTFKVEASTHDGSGSSTQSGTQHQQLRLLQDSRHMLAGQASENASASSPYSNTKSFTSLSNLDSGDNSSGRSHRKITPIHTASPVLPPDRAGGSGLHHATQPRQAEQNCDSQAFAMDGLSQDPILGAHRESSSNPSERAFSPLIIARGPSFFDGYGMKLSDEKPSASVVDSTGTAKDGHPTTDKNITENRTKDQKKNKDKDKKENKNKKEDKNKNESKNKQLANAAHADEDEQDEVFAEPTFSVSTSAITTPTAIGIQQATTRHGIQEPGTGPQDSAARSTATSRTGLITAAPELIPKASKGKEYGVYVQFALSTPSSSHDIEMLLMALKPLFNVQAHGNMPPFVGSYREPPVPQLRALKLRNRNLKEAPAGTRQSTLPLRLTEARFQQGTPHPPTLPLSVLGKSIKISASHTNDNLVQKLAPGLPRQPEAAFTDAIELNEVGLVLFKPIVPCSSVAELRDEAEPAQHQNRTEPTAAQQRRPQQQLQEQQKQQQHMLPLKVESGNAKTSASGGLAHARSSDGADG
ncbi:hypothetical protein OC835_006739 [Tilletia horrida]|nr:hypothetical protein OC835_006739 [Tilletia horrida]